MVVLVRSTSLNWMLEYEKREDEKYEISMREDAQTLREIKKNMKLLLVMINDFVCSLWMFPL